MYFFSQTLAIYQKTVSRAGSPRFEPWCEKKKLTNADQQIYIDFQQKLQAWEKIISF